MVKLTCFLNVEQQKAPGKNDTGRKKFKWHFT